jgi:hypothetical protein
MNALLRTWKQNAASRGSNRRKFFDEFRLIIIKCRKKARPAALFTLTYPEHLGAAGWADTLSSGSAIFHGYFLGVLHFSLGFAFHTVSFHLITSFNFYFVKPFAPLSLGTSA